MMRAPPSWSILLVSCCLFAQADAETFAIDDDSLACCDSLRVAERYADAAACALELLADLDARGDGDSALAAEVLAVLVRSQLTSGRRLDPSCTGFADRLLTSTSRLHGPDHPEMAVALLLSGMVTERSGDFVGARTNFERGLAILTAAGAPDDKDLASCLIALANVKARLGDFEGLDALYDRALVVSLKVGGPGTALVARVLVNHAIFRKLIGDFVGARGFYDRALEIQIALHGEDHRDVARTYYNLGNLLVLAGDPTTARARYLKSLAIRERVLGPEAPDVARALIALALVEKQAADLLLAREYAERAVAIQQRSLPPLHPQTAEALATLAAIQSDLGDLESARTTLEQVQEVYTRAYGPDHSRVGEVEAELGMLRQLAGDLEGALETYRRVRSKFEARNANSEGVAGILNVEAMVLADMGRLDEAVVAATRSLEIRERQRGSTHLSCGWSLATLGRCLWQEGESVRADSVLCRSLEILGSVKDADDPIYLSAQFDLARARRSRGAVPDALDLALAVERGRRDALRLSMSGLPERLGLVYMDRWPNGLDLALTLAADSTTAPALTARIWTELIRSRALVLDEMARRRRAVPDTHDVRVDSLRTELARTTRELAGLLISGWWGDGSDDEPGQALVLRERRERIEQQLGSSPWRDGQSTRGESVTLADVGAALPGDTAMIGYVRYNRHRRAAATDATTVAERFTRPAYAAFVLPVDRFDPVLVDLGSAAEIDRLVRVWRDEAGAGRQIPGRDAAAAARAYRRAGVALRERIWDPVVALCGEARQVDLIPDGDLHLVNFAALPTVDDRFLIDEDRPIVYRGIERDLVDQRPTRKVGGELLAFGAPDFGAAVAHFDLEPLPASAAEVREVTALWRRARSEIKDDPAVLALFGADASEAAFKSLAPGYGALHVATHGFFLSDRLANLRPGQRGVGGLKMEGSAASSPVAAANPMLRSGLVLAGDRGGDTADQGGEDGILTAAEIAVLDLGGVDWVVLSACESGVGTTRAGEGVFGLRRAFRIAGAHDLVISLWPLADDVMRDWMLQLYTAHLVDRVDLVAATWQASRAVLAARRAAGLDTHPQTWAGFIACGD